MKAPRARNANQLPLPGVRGTASLGGEADAEVSRLLQQEVAFVWMSRGKVIFMSPILDELLEEYARLNGEA